MYRSTGERVFFFFSSRRRHTRCGRDWSSDVCSSDLRVAAALDSARKWNAHVILKGFRTLIVSPEGKLFVNTSGNPGLSKGGSGDVLTGILAALTAQFGTADWVRVLALGVYLHGVAADLLAAEGEEVSGMLASEVAGAVPGAREWLLREIRFGA